MTVASEQVIHRWGTGLGVRMTAPLAQAAKLTQGTPVLLVATDDGILIRPLAQARRSLAQKLKAFDPAKHGGEAMVMPSRVGAERV